MSNFTLDDSRKAVVGGKSTVTGNAVSIGAIPLGSTNALEVSIVDGSGNQITTFGGGTQYTDAGAAATHPIGTGIIFNNAGTYNFVSLAQGLPVTPATGASFGSSTADEATFTPGSTTGGISMGVYQTTPSTITNNQAAAVAIDINRNTKVTQVQTQAPAATTMQSAAVASGNGTVLACAGYASVELNITASVAMSGGTQINFEYSPDSGTTWVALRCFNEGTTTWATTTTAPGVWRASVNGIAGSQVRARISLYSAGTITITGQLEVQPGVMSTESTMSTLLAGENLTTNRLNNEEVYSYASITTQTTTVVKNAAGTLAGFLIPTPLASATIKVYDNGAASGSVMVDTITFPAALLSSGPVFVKVNTSFATGCTVVTAGATMAVDVYYR
jgi:hypothetical protein